MQSRSLLLLSVALVLSACSTTQGVKQQSAAPVMEAGPGAGGKTTAPTTGSGGYLEGDGPGPGAPNLDAIPDAVPKAEPLHRYANRPYTALGKTYTPLQAPGSYKERGVASWYGKKFHGQRTSIGEVYDMYSMTAAHPTLPIPSYARVTNLANGKSVVVRINDRGPFLHDRIMDMSYAAAYKLGYVHKGSTEVEVESIAVEGAPLQTGSVEAPAVQVSPLADSSPAVAALPVETAEPAKGQVYLQLGAFKSQEGAESFLIHMRTELGNQGKQLRLFNKAGLTRVQIGPYASMAQARAAADKLAKNLGFKPFVSQR